MLQSDGIGIAGTSQVVFTDGNVVKVKVKFECDVKILIENVIIITLKKLRKVVMKERG